MTAGRCSSEGNGSQGGLKTWACHAIQLGTRWTPGWRKRAPALYIALDVAAEAVGDAPLLRFPVAVAHHLRH